MVPFQKRPYCHTTNHHSHPLVGTAHLGRPLLKGQRVLAKEKGRGDSTSAPPRNKVKAATWGPTRSFPESYSKHFGWKLKNAFICSGNASPAWCSGLSKRQKEKRKKMVTRTNCKCDVKMDMQPTRSATSLTFLLKLFIHRKKKNVGDEKEKKKKKHNVRPEI